MSETIEAVTPCMDGDKYDAWRQLEKVKEELSEMDKAFYEDGNKGKAHLAEETVDLLVATFTFFCASFTFEEMRDAIHMVYSKNHLRHAGTIQDWLSSRDCRGETINTVPKLLLIMTKQGAHGTSKSMSA